MHRRIPELKEEYAKQHKNRHLSFLNAETLTRRSMTYYFADHQICLSMYLFLHAFGIKRLKLVRSHFDKNGISVREHGSLNQVSKRKSIITFQDTENIVKFLNEYAEKWAIPLPGRLPQCRNFAKVVKLPSCDTKIVVYRKFQEACENADIDIRVPGTTTFKDIWNQFCPHIMTMKPASDLCDVCRINHLKLSRLANASFDEQQETLKLATEHLNTAKMQRDRYNSWREKAKKEKDPSLAVLSFDYAQNVSYPSSPQQVGSSYFKANRKCGLFGIHDEATGIQTNITIDEEDSVGKGGNAVISMLHFYLEKCPAKNIVLFSDNCVGQNKNNAVLHYLLWRILTSRNSTISLNFLLTGHTKFSPDRNFGILKAKYGKSIVDCQEDLIKVIQTSSPGGFNLAVPSKEPQTKIRNVFWGQWDVYLKQFFCPIVGLTKYHHFNFHIDGRITGKLFDDSPEIILHEEMKLKLEKSNSLVITEPEGFSLHRSWYLYEEVRSLCMKEESKDLLAPQPTEPKPKKIKKETKEMKVAKEKENDSVKTKSTKKVKHETVKSKRAKKN